ncbi:hypothetical protein GCM10020001_008900 [Nonomuraea salmonea]
MVGCAFGGGRVGAVTARGVAGGAMLIGAITVLARVAGFAKQYAFAQTVGTNCLATAYMTANQIPNIVFEVVVGGALAGMVVPVLAGVSRERAGLIGSALLTWVVVVLVPVGVLTAVLAGPVMGLFLGGDIEGCADLSAMGEIGTRMLVVFAPRSRSTAWPWCSTACSRPMTVSRGPPSRLWCRASWSSWRTCCSCRSAVGTATSKGCRWRASWRCRWARASACCRWC